MHSRMELFQFYLNSLCVPGYFNSKLIGNFKCFRRILHDSFPVNLKITGSSCSGEANFIQKSIKYIKCTIPVIGNTNLYLERNNYCETEKYNHDACESVVIHYTCQQFAKRLRSDVTFQSMISSLSHSLYWLHPCDYP